MEMSITFADTAEVSPRRLSRRRRAWIAGGAALAVVVWALVALPYLTLTAETLPLYAGERVWIWLHVALGTVALLTGPVNLWLGFARTRLSLHRTLGTVYVVTVGLGALVSFRLAVTPSFGIVFGAGLAALGVVWLLTTGMAYVAIRRRRILQHQEWMIRSYVATFAFVLFRLIVGAMQAGGLGTLEEALTVAAWLCWSLPLVVTEVVLQSRRTLGPARV